MFAGVRNVIERSAADRCGTHSPGGPTTTTTTVAPSTTTTTTSTVAPTTTTRPASTTTTQSPTTSTTTPLPPLGGGLYSDQLGTNVYDWSWATRNLASTNPTRGTRAILFEPDGWAAVVLHAEPVTVTANRLRFSLHGGTTGGQVIRLFVTVNGVGRVDLDLSGACSDRRCMEGLLHPAAAGDRSWTDRRRLLAGLDRGKPGCRQHRRRHARPVTLVEFRTQLSRSPPRPPLRRCLPGSHRQQHLGGLTRRVASRMRAG